MGHPEETIPFIVSDYSVEDDKGAEIVKVNNNYQAINTLELKDVVKTNSLTFKFKKKQPHIPVSVFKISVF